MKNVVITGAASGIGKAAVKVFLENDWKVLIADIDEEAAEEVMKDLNDQGFSKEKIYFKKVDLTEDKSVEELFDYAIEEMGEVNSVVNNAGLTYTGMLHETTEDEWNGTFDLIVKAIYYSSKHVVPHMIDNGGGTIVNTASISGLQADYNMAAYNAAKGAVVNLARAMALDYGKYNIRVNNVAPYATRTPLFMDNPDDVVEQFEEVNPMKRIAEPEDIARTMQFLASDESDFVNGANVPVSGGIENYNGQPVQ